MKVLALMLLFNLSLPSEQDLELMWQGAIFLVGGGISSKRPRVEIETFGGDKATAAGFADVERGIVLLNKDKVLVEPSYYVWIYIMHEYIHFILDEKGLHSRLHHCWMAKNEVLFKILNFVYEHNFVKKEDRSVAQWKAVKNVKKDLFYCIHDGLWHHPFVQKGVYWFDGAKPN